MKDVDRERKIIYTDDLPRGVILEFEYSLYVGTGPISSEGDVQQ